jgi:glutathionyl-hydroquinone reductase
VEIDQLKDQIYKNVNNGVYQAGFAITQAAYEEAVVPLFETLDWLEVRLSGSRWLIGDRLTEADIRLFTTLVRFDTAYHGHLKCNLRRIVDYPALWRFAPGRLRRAWRRRDGEPRPYQAPRLREPSDLQSVGRGAARTDHRLRDAGVE